MKNPPLVVYSELSRRFYAVTRYSIHGKGLITAQIKYDVTDSFMEAMERYQKDVRSASPEAPAAPERINEIVLTLEMVDKRLAELASLKPFHSEDLEMEWETMLSHKSALINKAIVAAPEPNEKGDVEKS